MFFQIIFHMRLETLLVRSNLPIELITITLLFYTTTIRGKVALVEGVGKHEA